MKFKKILVANRGEIALRIIRTCKEMGIKTVAIYSTADRESLHVRFADEAVCVGPPESPKSYLSISNVLSAIELTNADAIHPGYGFLAENPKLASVCSDYGIKFIGPTAEQIKVLGDKANAKQLMKKNNIPIIEGSDGIIESVNEAKKVAKEIKYPVMIKASGGGGGKGMGIVWNEKELEEQFQTAKKVAKASFDNDGILIEKYLEDPKHIEIQIVGDIKGKVIHLSERDCSIQRRYQKLLEESPSPYVNDSLRKKMGEVAIKAAKAVNYEGLGTVEFLVDKNKNFYFLEMNTRIQVEHPVTEAVVNCDLVKEQIQVADGQPLSGKNYFPTQHAIEMRINAEDPFNNFMPSPGKVLNFHVPGGLGIRVDTHVYTNYVIPPYYDSMIAKLIAVAATREEAICKAQRALEEFIIEGVKTTIPFHRRLLNNLRFKEGNYTTHLIDNFSLEA